MTAPVYDLLTEYGVDSANSVISRSPAWVIAVVRLSLPLSFSRQSMSSIPGAIPGDGARTRGDILIITDDAINLHVSSSKDNYLGVMQAVLKGSRNYLVDILPDDWILCWIVNSIDKRDELVRRIRALEACNKWLDGLKCLARVDSIREALSLSSDGKLSRTFALNSYAFKELDTSVFYDFQLAEVAQGHVGTWLAKIGLDISKLFETRSDGSVEDNVDKIIPALFEILLGRGLDSSKINPGASENLVAAVGAGAEISLKNRDAPFAYLVPEEVGRLLGRTSRSKTGGILAYADIIDLVMGVQTYSNTAAHAVPYNLFKPDINEGKSSGTYRRTGTPLLGAFIPLNPSFAGTPVWNVLSQFLNPPLNEMYTTLRVSENGSVVPTIVLRQIPFTTEHFQAPLLNKIVNPVPSGTDGPDQQTEVPIPVTRFLNLPRWRMAPQMLKRVNIGRSNATRINYVHVYGQNALHTGIIVPYQLAQNPPIRDDIDIQRCGLHPYIAQTAVDTVNQAGHTPEAWMKIVSDRLMGSQLSLNGAMQSIGISAPIPVGDNLEFDNVVYHIENVDHTCAISPDGHRTFDTTIRLSNGMSATPSSSDISLYPGVKQTDLSSGVPGFGGIMDESEEADLTQPDPLNQKINMNAIPAGDSGNTGGLA